FVVGVQFLGRAENDGTGREEQVDVVRHVNAAAHVRARRHEHHSAAGSRGRGNGAIDRRAVQRLAIARGAVAAHIEDGGRGGLVGVVGEGMNRQQNRRGGNQTGDTNSYQFLHSV